MLVDACDYDTMYQELDISLDSILDPYVTDYLESSPWDKFSMQATDSCYSSDFEDFQFDFNESQCLTQDLMWSSGAEDLEDEAKDLKKTPEKPPASPVTVKPSLPPAVVTPPVQRSLLIKSQPQYQPVSSVYSPPQSDDEGERQSGKWMDDEDEGQTQKLLDDESEGPTPTQEMLGEHIQVSIKDYMFNSDNEFLDMLDFTKFGCTDSITKCIAAPLLSPRSLSPPPRPSFEMDHCYSKELEPDDDGPYENNLGVDTPSETEDEEENERTDESFEREEENHQNDDDEDERKPEEAESIMRMANDDEDEEIDVVSVSDHPLDIRAGNSYLFPKALNTTRNNVYGSYGTIPKKTLPIPERKCVNGKYILMDMEVPTPFKRNTGRIATKPVSKKRRRLSSSDEEEDEEEDDDSDSESSYKRSYSRYGSRKPRSPPKKRRVSVELETGSDKRNLHNSLERMRRIGLKNLFDTLRNTIPSISQRERTAKVVILNTATSTVTQVQRQDEKYTAEKVALKRKQEMLRKRLSELRKSAARFR